MKMVFLSEEELLLRAKMGNESCLNVLLAKYEPSLHRYLAERGFRDSAIRPLKDQIKAKFVQYFEQPRQMFLFDFQDCMYRFAEELIKI